MKTTSATKSEAKATGKNSANGKKLLIVESPSKAKTIGKYLGNDYIVIASVGHIRDLPKSNKKALDIEAGFVPHYEISPKKEQVIADIKREASKASEIFLGTDQDREGEAIAWHIQDAAKLKGAKRITFSEITPDAIKEALKHPREIDIKLKEAQEARRVLDRLVGYDLSGVIWKKVRYGLSAGRVQSPALRIIVEREREIKAFIPEQFFRISVDLDANKTKLPFECSEEPRQATRANEIVEWANEKKWKVTKIDVTQAKRSARAPFITSTLQQTASTRLGFSPSKTMMLAQKLYEAGHISYMRTDSTQLGKTAIAEISAVITKEYGVNFLDVKQFASKSKNAQEAHEAIRPTHVSKESAGADPDQKKLYELIRARTLASQMADAKIERTKIVAHPNVDMHIKDNPDFSVTGSRILFEGWLKADPDGSGDDVILPKVTEGQILDLIEVRKEEKFTEPPGRYTEAGLVKELEKRDIGRPSTYASIIKTLEDRQYVEKINKSLKPTDTGEVVSGFLEENFMKYISDEFTAEMEDKLDGIAIGKEKYVDMLSKFYGPFLKDVKEKDKMEKATNLGIADEKFKCPKCSSGMIIKLARTGKFLSCSTYPDCDGALTIDGEDIQKDTPLGRDPETGLDIWVKVGRFGPYVQLGERATGKGSKTAAKPRMASIPKTKNLAELTVADALVYLSLPRKLGEMPDGNHAGKMITASIGRFGPYIVCDGDFRSLKTDDPYTITFDRAVEILRMPKVVGRRGGFKKKVKPDESK